MPDRRDYLAVCNDQGVPLVDFQATFCVRCVQPQCSRSRAGGLFETRVASWQERLFNNPPRMSKDEPLYNILAAKRFVEIDVGRTPDIHGRSDWVDPRTVLDEPEEPAAKPRAARPPRPSLTGGGEAILRPEPANPRTERHAPLNTPFVQGTMLEGHPTPANPDRWSAAPTLASPESPSAPVVKTGAKLKFTSG